MGHLVIDPLFVRITVSGHGRQGYANNLLFGPLPVTSSSCKSTDGHLDVDSILGCMSLGHLDKWPGTNGEV